MNSVVRRDPRSTASVFTVELGSRVSAVLSLYDTRQSAANVAGVSTDQLLKYEKGTASPRWETLVRLAAEKGVSLNWLATGDGEMFASAGSATGLEMSAAVTDARLIGRLTEKILLVYKEMGQAIAVHQAAERAALEHNAIVAKEADPDERLIMVGEVVAKLRQELQVAATNPASSKHRA